MGSSKKEERSQEAALEESLQADQPLLARQQLTEDLPSHPQK